MSLSGLQTMFGESLDTSKRHGCSCHISTKFSSMARDQAVRGTFVLMWKKTTTPEIWTAFNVLGSNNIVSCWICYSYTDDLSSKFH